MRRFVRGQDAAKMVTEPIPAAAERRDPVQCGTAMIFKTETSSVQSAWQGFDRKTFPAGATIFAEGDTGTTAFILLQGDVTLRAGNEGGRPRVVVEIKPGQMFGMHALMAGA